MLRGKKPEMIEKRLKALFYGKANVGKTMAAIQFPTPYLIDTEKGAEHDEYVDALAKNNGAYFFTTDADDLIAEVTSLLSTKHSYKTLIIDPLTTIYSDLVDKAAIAGGTDFGRHKIPADRKIKHLISLLYRLDMNVIITSHAKSNWVRAKDAQGRDTIIEDGLTFDCYGKLDYIFDLVFEVQKRGSSRVGIVKKTRIKAFPEGDQFPFSYDAIADRYGRHILEKDAKPEELATKEQIEEIQRLIGVLKTPDEVWQKWLDKAEAVNFSEMNTIHIKKCIDLLNSKFKGEAA